VAGVVFRWWVGLPTSVLPAGYALGDGLDNSGSCDSEKPPALPGAFCCGGL